MNKIFAIGDIHGCLAKLQTLIKKIDADPQNDKLVFIGDYIDRGDYSKEVVDYVIRLKSRYKQVVCLLGNHEQMFLRYLEGIDESMYLINGGRTTLHSYGIARSDGPERRRAKIPLEHLRFFESLLPYHEDGKYLFIHAGLRPGVSLSHQTINDFVWIRREFIDSREDFGKTVVFGHTPGEYPLIMFNKIGIDTGAVYGGQLTCVELPEVRIHQV